MFAAVLMIFSDVAYSQVSGIIPSMADSVWTLENNSGFKVKIKGDKEGHFLIDLTKIKEGTYLFGDLEEIYLKPDYKFTIKFNEGKFHFEGKGSLENNLIQESKISLEKVFGNSGYGVSFGTLLTEPGIFIPQLNKYSENTKQLAKQSKNILFQQFLIEDAEFVKRYILYCYTRFYGLDSSKMAPLKKVLGIPIADRKADYKNMLAEAYQSQFSKKLLVDEKTDLNKIMYTAWDLNNEDLFKNSKYYRDMITYRMDYLVNLPENKTLKDSIKNEYLIKLRLVNNLIKNPYVNEYHNYIYSNGGINRTKDSVQVTDIYKSFIVKAKNPAYINDVEKSYQNFKGRATKSVAPDFNYPNEDGKMVSLKSLKGKYVYIDIWATWCVPCIAEIPALKKLEEQYRGKNIQFVSISVDNISDKMKWVNYVKENNLQGLQLMADNSINSAFMKTFAVSTIPRFLLIGPDGAIIDNDAKRPTDVELVKKLATFKL